MPIYKINYTEVWSNEFYIEARSKEEADSIFATAAERDIIHPGDDCMFDSADWTTMEMPDAPDLYIDASYRDFENPEPDAVDTLLNDPAFYILGTTILSQSVSTDYVRTIWEQIKHDVAQDILECTTIEECNEDDLRLAVGRVMMKHLNIEQ